MTHNAHKSGNGSAMERHAESEENKKEFVKNMKTWIAATQEHHNAAV